MLGSGDPTPYDLPLVGLLIALAILLLIGAATTASWSPMAAVVVRRGALALGVASTAAVLIVTPTTNGIVGAGRLLFVWPSVAFLLVGFLAWSWRVGRL